MIINMPLRFASRAALAQKATHFVHKSLELKRLNDLDAVQRGNFVAWSLRPTRVNRRMLAWSRWRWDRRALLGLPRPLGAELRKVERADSGKGTLAVCKCCADLLFQLVACLSDACSGRRRRQRNGRITFHLHRSSCLPSRAGRGSKLTDGRRRRGRSLGTAWHGSCRWRWRRHFCDPCCSRAPPCTLG